MNTKKLTIIPIIIASFSLTACGFLNQQRTISGVKMWDQYIDGDNATTLAESGVTLDEYQNVVFTRTSSDYSLEANGERLFSGVFSFYAADFNNDGYRELCLGVSVGSGIIDERIEIYDYHNNKVIFSLNDRFNHDYYLTLSGERLFVKETKSMKPDKITRYGSFYADNKGTVSVVWDDKTQYSLDVIDDSRLLVNPPHLQDKKPQNSFKAGDTVLFKTAIVYDADVIVMLNDTQLSGEYYDGCYNFSFIMPPTASVLEIYIRGGRYI